MKEQEVVQQAQEIIESGRAFPVRFNRQMLAVSGYNIGRYIDQYRRDDPVLLGDERYKERILDENGLYRKLEKKIQDGAQSLIKTGRQPVLCLSEDEVDVITFSAKRSKAFEDSYNLALYTESLSLKGRDIETVEGNILNDLFYSFQYAGGRQTHDTNDLMNSSVIRIPKDSQTLRCSSPTDIRTRNRTQNRFFNRFWRAA